MFYYKNNFYYFWQFLNFSILKYKNFYYNFYSVLNKSLILPDLGHLVIINKVFVNYYITPINLYKYFLYNLRYLKYSWERFIVKKIKYRFKGGWIFVNHSFLNLIFEFGRSHRVYFFLYNLKFLRKKRLLEASSFIFWGINIRYINYILHLMCLVRNFNSYTSLGIRFSRQKYYKRIGKVSKYTMFKSKIF